MSGVESMDEEEWNGRVEPARDVAHLIGAPLWPDQETGLYILANALLIGGLSRDKAAHLARECWLALAPQPPQPARTGEGT